MKNRNKVLKNCSYHTWLVGETHLRLVKYLFKSIPDHCTIVEGHFIDNYDECQVHGEAEPKVELDESSQSNGGIVIIAFSQSVPSVLTFSWVGGGWEDFLARLGEQVKVNPVLEHHARSGKKMSVLVYLRKDINHYPDPLTS